MFKVGDEVLIKAEITDVHEGNERPYFIAPNPYGINWVSEEKIIPATKTYEQGLEDAMEILRKVKDLSVDEREKILGYKTLEAIIADLTMEYVAEQLDAYEKEKEIKVGDVVNVYPVSGGKFSAVVVRRDYGNRFDVVYKDGITAAGVPLKLIRNTGKHIDIESLLKQIGE